ncbi:HopJ type III effector protein [Faecalibacter sp. LW9]|uniref:HopJ type III effector protein n=1 Tax=Faecalibacter sp. LW9 TaxID=3103144 RepID=UPI002AFDD358|nr:HopJ type III effector protein [Faecalibacter sp. LW9]
MAQEILKGLEEGKVIFNDVIAYIESKYIHTPTAFKNGMQKNAADQNQGSAKVLAFGQLENLSVEDTLKLFAEHYQSVLDSPEGEDHQNIRQFMANGWEGVSFDSDVLILK